MEDQKYHIELRAGETTIVSWKKLLKKSTPPATTADPPPPPPLQDQHAQTQQQDDHALAQAPEPAPAQHRFSAVIEKIERLYVGNQSSDEEELGDVPDDDQYDTEDSFIDDADLDEYFQVDKSTTKHTGFFVNRGKLESTSDASSSPKHTPRKRRKNDVTICAQIDNEHLPNKHAKIANMRMKAAARTAPLLGIKTSGSSQILTAKSEHGFAENLSQSNTSIVPSTNKSSDPSMSMDQSLSSKVNRDVGNVLKVTSEHFDDSPHLYQDKSPRTQTDLQSRRPLNDTREMDTSTKVRQKDRNSRKELPDLNFPSSDISVKPTKTPIHVKEGSSVRSKGSILEKAIRELEKIVAESRPRSIEVLVTDTTSQAVKRRLPREVKQKLARVARIASSQGKLSEELISRLMSILGHMVQLKTLKRNLKEMVELGLSAKREKDDEFQHIKTEVVEMIKTRPPSLKIKVPKQRDGASGDCQEGRDYEDKGVQKVVYSMENAMEDKICDLYDLFVEGLDEEKGPHIRKLYVELAELWPSGTMDSHGIKNAVCRSKARKRAMCSRLKNQEKIKQKKLLTPKSEEIVREEGNSMAQLRLHQERVAIDLGSPVVSYLNGISSNTINQYLVTSESMSHLSTVGACLNQPKHEKIRGNSTTHLHEVNKTTDYAITKKKVKRKPESDLHSNPGTLSSQQGKERHKSREQVGNYHHKSSLHVVGLPGYEQSN